MYNILNITKEILQADNSNFLNVEFSFLDGDDEIVRKLGFSFDAESDEIRAEIEKVIAAYFADKDLAEASAEVEAAHKKADETINELLNV